MVTQISLNRAINIAYVDVLRRARILSSNRIRVFALLTLTFVPATVTVILAVIFADAVNPIQARITLPRPLVGNVGFLWLFSVFMFAQRFGMRRQKLPTEEFVLTSVSHRTATLGLLLGEIIGVLIFLAPPTIAVAVLLTLWFSPGSLVWLSISVGAFFTSAVSVGAGIGYTALVLGTRVQLIADNRRIASGVGIISFYALFALVLSEGGNLLSAFADFPLSSLLHLTFVGTWIDVNTHFIALGLVVAAALTLIGFLSTVSMTSLLWYGSSARQTTSNSNPTLDQTNFRPRVRGYSIIPVSDRLWRVAMLLMKRTLREPINLVPITLSALIVLVSFWLTASSVNSLAPTAPAFVVILWPWFVGGVFTLNIIGDEGEVLSTIILSSMSERKYLVARCLPAMVTGVIGVILFGTFLGATTGSSAIRIFGTISIGCLVALAVPFVGAGAGFVFPQFRTAQVAEADPAPPSMLSTLTYSIVVWTTGGVAIATFYAPTTVTDVAAWIIRSIARVVQNLLFLLETSSEWPTTVSDAVSAGITQTPQSTIRIVGIGVLLCALYFIAFAVVVRVPTYMVSHATRGM